MSVRLDRERGRRRSRLVESGFVVASLLAVVVLRFDTLSGASPAEAGLPTVAGAFVGAGLLLFTTSPTFERLDRDWLVTLVVAAVVIFGGHLLLAAVGEPDAMVGPLGFLLAFGAGLLARRSVVARA